MFSKFKGVGVALVTPFTAEGKVDYKALGRLLKFTADGGVDYFVVHGTTGESFTTTPEEKAEILKFILKNNSRELPIVYGLGGNNTQSIIKELKSLDLSGVDAILSVSPAYCLPTQEGIYQHYLALADAAPKPIILYNVPGRTGKNITAETTLRLAQHKNIIGIKEACKEFGQSIEIARSKPHDFLLISGDDMLTVPLVSIGGVGVISVMANALPSIFCRMVHKALEGNQEQARQALFKITALNNLLYCEANPVGIKQALKEAGICEPFVRLPLLKASNGLVADLKDALTKIAE